MLQIWIRVRDLVLFDLWIRDRKNPESAKTIPDHNWVKNTYILPGSGAFFTLDLRSRIRDLGFWMEKFGSGIWDKHPGSTKLISAHPTFMPCLASCIHYFCIMRAWLIQANHAMMRACQQNTVQVQRASTTTPAFSLQVDSNITISNRICIIFLTHLVYRLSVRNIATIYIIVSSDGGCKIMRQG